MVHMLLSQVLVIGALFVYASFFDWRNAPVLIGLHVPLRTRRHFEWECEEGSLCPVDDPFGHRG
jgi:hypothetical protein